MIESDAAMAHFIRVRRNHTCNGDQSTAGHELHVGDTGAMNI